jgi:pimeloyl-ACP methyl ester carboxylesterase
MFRKILVLLVALTVPSIASARQRAVSFPTSVEARSLATANRRMLTANVAEYSFKLRVGPGPYDEIGIHRVVRETAPNRPAHTTDAVFLAPGDIWNFRAAFLTGAHPLPVFLAENGIDVWGIDYRWTLVPGGLPDYSFMQSWGIAQDARDLAAALAVARVGRALTGSGLNKLFLLGWSRGGQIGYAYLSEETRVPQILRQVRGFIPVDIYLKTDVPALKSAACQRAQNTNTAIAGGAYANTSGALIATLGNLAVSAPSGTSPIVPTLTNRQAGLLVGEATFTFLAPLEPAPFYHFTGGVFDSEGKPAGLLYSNEADLFAFEQASSPVQPNRELADADAATCDATNVPFDDHLDDIKVPILYIGAGGGFGEYGIYTTTLLDSTDVSTLIIDKLPDTQRLLDYGHADLFLANNAQTLVWQPILNWLHSH